MTVPIFVITGLPVFDYMFSLVFWFGVLGIVPAAMFRLFRW